MLAQPSVVCPVLVGRDAHLSTVLYTLDRARDAHGGTLLVSGEAGIGKSRLVRALVERGRALGFVVLQGACFEADRAQPYAPVLDLVRVAAATASPALAAHWFAPAATELVTLFPELRSIFADAAPRAALAPEEEKRRLFHAVAGAVQALGKVQPVLLVVEDVHWSDDATLDLVLDLARRLAAQPIALVLTFRSDEVGPRLARLLADLDRARCAAEVALRPLGVPEVSAMLQAIFGSRVAFGAGFVDRLQELTEGNPFFVEEMLKALLHEGDLARDGETWRARPLEQVRVPRTATEAVARRLAGLSEAARQVAAMAAVAGRRFDFGLLQALTRHDEGELLALVRELVEAQLVVEESTDRFAFRHALTREAMCKRLLARERVALHRAIAAALEQQADGRAHDVADALAYHCFEAGMWEPARQWARRAADHARTLGAPREALQQLERAVTATANAGLVVEPELLVARGRAHETLGSFAPANEDFATALADARAAGDRRNEWAALHALGLLWAARDYARAGRYRLEALEVARAIGDPTLVARSLNRVGNWHVNREEPHAGIPYHDEALAICERERDQRGVAETLDLLGMAHHIAGRQETAVGFYERALALSTALDHRRARASTLSVLSACGPSHHASPVRAYESPRTPMREAGLAAMRLTSEIGHRAGEAFSRFILADACCWQGDYALALRLGREALAIAEELEHREWQCGARCSLAAVAMDLCVPAEAVALLEPAHGIARRLGSATWTRWTGAQLAAAMAAAGEPLLAVATLDAVDRVVPPSGDPSTRTMGERFLRLARGEATLAADAPAEALAIADEWRELDAPHAASDGATRGVPRVALLRARALAALGRCDDALAALDVAHADATRQGARSLLWRIEATRGAVHLGERRRTEARRAFDSARAQASALTAGLDDATTIATFLAGVDLLAPPPPRPTRARAAKAAYGGLTRRERDTAALVARGDSNRAIARALGIGERTVEGYVAAALAKLGFSSRAQIAVWATEQGLAATVPGAGSARR